jgi:hypothetical protein
LEPVQGAQHEFQYSSALTVTPQSERSVETSRPEVKHHPVASTKIPATITPKESSFLKVILRGARDLPHTGNGFHDQEYFVCISVFHHLTQMDYVSHRVDFVQERLVRLDNSS